MNVGYLKLIQTICTLSFIVGCTILEEIYREYLFHKSIEWGILLQANSSSIWLKFLSILTNLGAPVVMIPCLGLIMLFFPINQNNSEQIHYWG